LDFRLNLDCNVNQIPDHQSYNIGRVNLNIG